MVPDMLSSQAKTELLLLQTYRVQTPAAKRDASVQFGESDPVATGILQSFQPAMLVCHRPLSVLGDGNCLYRALSRGLIGNESLHFHIRLLTVLEMISHLEFYDSSSPHFIDLVKGIRIVSDGFDSLLQSAVSPGGYGQMLHIFAASASLAIALRSHCPTTPNPHMLSEPFTRAICGRGVQVSAQPQVTLMWSQMSIPKSYTAFSPNHFVVLHPLEQRPSAVVDLTTDEAAASYVSCPDTASEAGSVTMSAS